MKKVWILLGAVFVGLLYFYRQPIGGLIMGLYDDLYKKWADLRGLDWKLLKAVAIHESSENPNAVGTSGEIGLCQIMLALGRAYGMSPDDLYIPDNNLQVASGFLKELFDKYPNASMEEILQMYNLGETKFRKGIRNPQYAQAVLKNYDSITGVA